MYSSGLFLATILYFFTDVYGTLSTMREETDSTYPDFSLPLIDLALSQWNTTTAISSKIDSNGEKNINAKQIIVRIVKSLDEEILSTNISVGVSRYE